MIPPFFMIIFTMAPLWEFGLALDSSLAVFLVSSVCFHNSSIMEVGYFYKRHFLDILETVYIMVM